MRLYSPNGSLIVGTLETMRGSAQIEPDSFTKLPDGKYGFEYDGYTDVWWDESATATDSRGMRVFVDEDGAFWPEDQLVQTAQ